MLGKLRKLMKGTRVAVNSRDGKMGIRKHYADYEFKYQGFGWFYKFVILKRGSCERRCTYDLHSRHQVKQFKYTHICFNVWDSNNVEWKHYVHKARGILTIWDKIWFQVKQCVCEKGYVLGKGE